MRVALIQADQDIWALGIRTLSAVLKDAGHATRLIFLSTDERQLSTDALKAVRAGVADCELIGVSSVSRGSDKAKQVLQHLRPLARPTIWGGVHATMDPQECSEHADLVCLGEGEGLIVELADRLGRGQGVKDLANVAYRHEGRLVVNEMRPLVRNLDDLPLPDVQ